MRHARAQHIYLQCIGRAQALLRRATLPHGCVVALVVLLALMIVPRASSALQHEYSFVTAWGSRGDQPGQYDTPVGLATGSDGSVYIADSSNHRIQKLAADGSVLAVWGRLGSTPGNFNHPWGIAVDADHIYVADRDNQRIQVFDASGAFVTAWDTPGARPTGLAASGARLYVTDPTNQRVLVYTTSGALIRQWGGYGGLFGQFFTPLGIAAAADGSVYVVDSGNHRVQHFDANGQFLDAFGSYGHRCWEMDVPSYIAIAPSGNLLISDQAIDQVKELTPEGGCVSWFGTSGEGAGQMRTPLGVAADATGQVYVADSRNGRVLVYAYRELALNHRVYLPVVLNAYYDYYEKRVNAGDAMYVDSKGQRWEADQEYRPGSWGYIGKEGGVFTTSETITGTTDPILYQSERFSMAGYAFDVRVGYYEVTLKFAEIFYDRPGQRIFSVNIEGQPKLQDLDIFAEVERYHALDYVFPLPVTDGQLNIAFIPKGPSDAPKISAIAVRQLSEYTEVTPTPTPATEFTVVLGAEDTFIDFYSPTINFDGLPTIAVRPYRADQGRGALLRFDLSSIPPNATILEASLSVRASERTNANALYVGAYRLLRRWAASETTWISATQQMLWGVPGAQGTGDRLAQAEDALAIDSVDTTYTFTLISLVQDWLDHPQQNSGVVLQGSSVGAVQYTFGSSEHIREEYRPRLTVHYSILPRPATATPSVTPSRTPPPTATATPTMTPTPSATVVILQQELNGYLGVRDTYISSWLPDTNYVTSTALYLRSNDLLDVMLRFDLSAIPPDVELAEATLSAFAYASSNSNLLVADAFELLRPWSVTETTWLSATQAIPWSVPGANGLGTDRSDTSSDAQAFDSINRWITFTLTSLVQDWIRDPQSNYGLIVKARNGDAVGYSIVSSESTSVSQRPFLMLTYRRPEAIAPP